MACEGNGMSDARIGEALIKDAIDGMASCSGSSWDQFKKVAERVFVNGITWERIAVLFYVAGRLAVKMVKVHLSQSVKDIREWTVRFFRNNLLEWIQERGGWMNIFSELAVASMQTVSSMSSHSYGLVAIFITGLALGNIITWGLTIQP